MSSPNPLVRLEQRAAEADQIIEYLKQQVQLLKEKASKCFQVYSIIGRNIAQLRGPAFAIFHPVVCLR